MKVDIIETGSTGNCFLFDEKIMIDCGLPMSRMASVDFSKVTHILLTHIHGDHFNGSSIRKIHNTYGNIIFVCGEWLLEDLRLIFANKTDRVKVVGFSEAVSIGDYKISPCKAYHDVENCGYWIMKNGYKHFHITDTSTVRGISAMGYDSATIECNYCEIAIIDKINEAEDRGEYTHLKRAVRSHLSVQEAVEWCKINKIKKVIPIHIGKSTKKEVLEYVGERVK